MNRIETINIDDELENEGAVEDDEADDDIEETRVNSLSAGVKKNVSTHQANGTPESSSTSDENDHNTILRNSLLKDISRLKKKMVYKREEPYLTNLLVDYSSDEDDD